MAFLDALLSALPDIDTAPLWQVQAMFLVFAAVVVALTWILFDLLSDRADRRWKAQQAEAEHRDAVDKATERARQDAKDRMVHAAVRGARS